MNEKIKHNMPLIIVSLLIFASFVLVIRAVLGMAQMFFSFVSEGAFAYYFHKEIAQIKQTSIIELAFVSALLIVTWLAATKVKVFQHIYWRLTVFILMVTGIAFYYIWATTTPIYNTVIPYLMERAEDVDMSNPMMYDVLVSNMDRVMLILLSIPSVSVAIVFLGLARFYTRHPEETKKYFREWEWSTSKLQNFFGMQEKEIWPNVDLGPDTKTNEMVRQKGKDRTVSNLIVGPPGTGKTSALILPILNQDLHHMTRMINDFKEKYPLPTYDKELKQYYLNGISVIEPSKDLCDKLYELVKAHRIPDEAVFYLDPTNPDTPSINLFKDPVDKVAENFCMVIEGLGEKTDFFFEQSQRTHLKHYIYLLKLHDPERVPTFDDLIDMYNNPQVVYRMHQKLKKTIPDNIAAIEDRDERNHWLIVKGIDEWFDMSLGIEVEGYGANAREARVTDRNSPFFGDPKVYDKRAEHVVGLRNILNDIASNKLLRRVLFGHSDFDFDKHLEYGGVLLVNTAKGELGALSDVFGKFVLLALQNAVFRRKPNVSSFHHILVDEFPDYIYEPFTDFPAQCRKYKVILTVASQTISQLARKYGNDYMQTLLGTLRHKFVYGDITTKDAELFSRLFGEELVYEEGQMDQEISPLLENPNRRVGSSYRQTEKPILSPNDLIFQEAFQCAVKLVEDNKPLPVRQIRANFVPREEFERAKVTVDEEAGKYWLEQRRAFLNQETTLLTEDIEKREETRQEQTALEEHQPIEECQLAQDHGSVFWPVAKTKRPIEDIKYERIRGLDTAFSPVNQGEHLEQNISPVSRDNQQHEEKVKESKHNADEPGPPSSGQNHRESKQEDEVDFESALAFHSEQKKEKAETERKVPYSYSQRANPKTQSYSPSTSVRPEQSRLDEQGTRLLNELNMKLGGDD